MARLSTEQPLTKYRWMPDSYTQNQVDPIWHVQVGDIVTHAFCMVGTAFNGTSPSAALGDDADVDRYITTTNSAIGTADTTPQAGSGAALAGSTKAHSGFLYSTEDTIDVDFTAATGTPTEGDVDWWCYVMRPYHH